MKSDRFFERDAESLAELFHENSKWWPDRINFTPALPDDLLARATRRAFKIYEDSVVIELPRKIDPVNMKLDMAIQLRRSRRDFTDGPMALEELSTLLELSVGLTGKMGADNDPVPLRAFPSAGGLYPLETYVFALNMTDLPSGLYHYNVRKHGLEGIVRADFRDSLYRNCMKQDFIKSASMVILMSAVFERSTIKYGQRGYRFALLDAGHAAQNMYLVATALNLGVVAIGGFCDDELNDILSIDGVHESALYLVAFGSLSSGER